MCRLVFSFDDNHQVAGATGAAKARLRQKGDLIDILADGQHAGDDVENDTVRYFIVDMVGLSKSAGRVEFTDLLEAGVEDDGPKRIRNLNFSGLRDRLDLAGKARFDNQRRLTMTSTRPDRRKIHASTRARN